LICGRLLFSSSSLQLSASRHFNNRWYSLSSSARRRHQTLSVHHHFIVQIASRNLCHASSFFQSAVGCLCLSSTGVFQILI
jgi:hypothetical protein